jgi:hypothetical protein
MLKSSSLCLYSSNLGTFWLKIEQFWPFEDISIFSNGGHLGWRTRWRTQFWSYGHLKKFLFLVMVAILDTGRHWRTQFWKGTTQGSFQQSLVEIGSVFSEEKNFFNFIPPIFLICIISQNRQKFKVHKKSCNIC